MVVNNNYELVADGEANLEFLIDGESCFEEDYVVDGEAGVVLGGGGHPAYTGPTEFTPTQSVQYAQTAGTSVLANIKINPIPSNYGLITWNGSTLTVS